MSNWNDANPPEEVGDPRPIDESLSRLAKTFRVEDPSVISSVRNIWTKEISGNPVAAKTKFEGFHNGIIHVSCSDRSWFNQVKMAHGSIIKTINSELGEGTVSGVEVRPN